ncbi:MAG TPA: hypothetical protein VFD39_11795 [Trueperaceae bacterium]|nr:hypothetical protein [Trueperaceae bacterium]
MTTVAQLRKAALALPATEEGTHLGMLAFKVSGKGFVSLTKDGFVQMAMAGEDIERALARLPAAERLTRQGKPQGLRIPLADVTGMELNSLVEKSWLSRAPKRLVAARREANRGEAPSGANALPSSIGKPATRALLAAEVRTLKDVATKTEADLLALHGVGPRAIRLLAEAMATRWLGFR